MWSQEQFANAVRVADLRTTELSSILDIHRVTISRWCNTPTAQPNRFMLPAMMRFLTMMELAIANGSLPLSPEIKGPERLPAIRRALGV